jgi:phospholipid/cholesterol/gamma-HCH transport system substrate-binding protein
MVNDTTIRVDMTIDKAIFRHIKKNAVSSIGSDGLVGNMIINIIPGKDVGVPVAPGDEIASKSRVRTDDMLSTFSKTNENAARLSADLLKITKEINRGKGTVGTLIMDTLMANDLKQTMAYLKSTVRETSLTAKNLDNLVASLNKKDNVLGVIKDTAVANKLKSMVNNLNNSSAAIDSVFTNLNATIVNMKQGKGAINYLANDPKLVKKIDSTMTNINSASLLLNQDLEALKHNFLLRGYFKKQEKQKAKEQKKKN